ncbi:hypothetical protein HELRODRAFT_159478 [Helobdella robusta]|uniref:C-type lectin domain-containing protein n=1 Tax=Helobdella robusta TaxID=6412 RepID=T1EP29_HELRO|nr:hypothetical protein HELRODRAFT_159478 [Helobdella robusta]ESO12892.1 hypothetical protein HELRODRAFT_159478 [Helobdella robusta]
MADYKMFILLVALSISGGDTCPNEFLNVGGRCVKVVLTQSTWEDAVNECDKLKANLAIIDTQPFLTGLTTYLSSNFKGKCVSSTLGTDGFWTAGLKRKTDLVFNWKIYRLSKFLDEIVYRNLKEANNWAPGKCISGYLETDGFWTAGLLRRTDRVFNWKIYRLSKFLDEIVYKNLKEANNWAPGEPNNPGSDEDCVELRNYGPKYQFNNIPCSLKNCLICQMA